MSKTHVTSEEAAAMGVSHEAYDQVTLIAGHLPTMEELSTLLAMWQSNGQQQSLYGWLCGQRHTVERDTYLYTGTDDTHRSIREPKVQECIDIAQKLCLVTPSDSTPHGGSIRQGELIYQVGGISTEFLDSDYGRKCLHISSVPRSCDDPDEEAAYHQMIVAALYDGGVVKSFRAIAEGGLFRTLVASVGTHIGFDLLTCREIRLDAFLFGEGSGRLIVSLKESEDDLFLSKMDEAHVDCCFLGRSTKGRVIVDGMDFGPIDRFILSAPPC